MKHVAYFGDGEKTFALTMPMIAELERKAGVGIGAFYQRLMSAQFFIADLIEIIRLGLIGAGTSPADAQRFVETYATDRPVMEIVPLALDILEARWSGEAVAQDDEPDFGETDFLDDEPAVTGDLAAAIREAYADV